MRPRKALGDIKYEVWKLGKALGVVKYEVWKLRKACGVVKYEFWSPGRSGCYPDLIERRLALLSRIPGSIPEASGRL